jgi:2-oxoglutarate dehydrogenase E1 component
LKAGKQPTDGRAATPSSRAGRQQVFDRAVFKNTGINRKKAIVAPAPDPSQTSSSASPRRSAATSTPGTSDDFGANDWLIEQMYEQYVADPSSVAPDWARLFAADSAPGSAPAESDSKNEQPKTAKPETEQPKTQQPKTQQPKTQPAQTQKPDQKTDQKKKTEPNVVNGSKQPISAAGPAAAQPVPTEAESVQSAPARPKEKPTSKPAKGAGVPADSPNPSHRPDVGAEEPVRTVLRGAPMRTAKNMDASLTVPTATSVRSLPVKLLIDQRVVINNYLRRARGGKVSYTHIIGYAIVQALKAIPDMNVSYGVTDGKPTLIKPAHINLGLAIDLPKPDGTRQLVVPSIKSAETLDFAQFWAAYEEIVKKARGNKLTIEDFAGTTISLTNPGTIGTNHSVPRLMNGQGAIVGVGSMDYPPEFQGSNPDRLNTLGISKILTLTSTYDHRVIQGALSGDFLGKLHALLLGEDGFYDDIFTSLRIPTAPIRWAQDRSTVHEDQVSKQARVFELINAYRVRGHLMADVDPIEYTMRDHPDLDVQTHELTLWDLDREFATGDFADGSGRMTLRKILGILRDSYCRTIGMEYMHISERDQRRWIQARVERPHESMPREEHLRILDKLNEAEVFETFLQTKYVGQKRFSLEGSESTIPLLDEICECAADDHLDEVTIGMAHRGRLNALANIVGKSYSQIFREFEGNIDPRTVQGSGDVKYHLGAEGKFTSLAGNTVKTSMAANPSHLEAVDPVLEGITRAKQDILDRGREYPVLPVLIHGDAAFAGQGVVAETLNLSQLRGYRVGGTIHVVVNNQVGFTTAPTESRSSTYATDVARMVQAPIFHVNGDDPEACIRVARLAYDFRREFNKDVVIDLICYRSRGHNEGDDPSITQPRMYDLISKKRSVRKLYTEALIGRGDITIEDAEQVMGRFQARLESVFEEVRQAATTSDDDLEYRRVPKYPEKAGASHGTAIKPEVMQKVADAHLDFPEGFTVHPKVLPQLQRRAKSIIEGPVDWATGELLALGSLMLEGRPVRLTGQDTRRGTFVQRFAAIVDRKTGKPWVPLQRLSPDQGKFHVYDSLLSEFAAMGFEYGYSVARPEALVLWEAQYGDFANGAQTIIDEFITAGYSKWGQKSGVVLLLPHGYEGQGSDHSSARIERWLQLAADDAFAVAQPSTAASHFHLLRNHALSSNHRPLIVLTPKRMLRMKAAASDPAEFTGGNWQPVLGDPSITDPAKVRRVLLSSGMARWDLMTERDKQGISEEIAVVSLERYYPLPAEEIAAELAKYENLQDLYWVQYEPRNQGAWPHLALNLPEALAEVGVNRPLVPVTRPASSAPATGSHKVHEMEQKQLIAAALG